MEPCVYYRVILHVYEFNDTKMKKVNSNFWLKYRVKLVLKNINFSSISNA